MVFRRRRRLAQITGQIMGQKMARAIGWAMGLAIALVLAGCQPNEGPTTDESPAPAETQAETQAAAPDQAESGQAGTAASAPKESASDPAKTAVAPAQPAAPAPGAPSQAKPDQAKAEADAIQIDETVCGAGGQEAYFETPKQEIYICKNEQQMLTYIATPKTQGNSIFLPAQKVEQGKAIGYVALDEAKTYVIAEKGYQLKENNKVLASERVTRRQLPNR